MNYIDPISKWMGEWTIGLNPWSVLFRILLAFLFAAIIGCERANKRHSCGLRTFILVSMTGAVAVLVDIFCVTDLGLNVSLLSAAALIGVATISANSFLFSSRSQIKGITTAVALWASFFIGLAFGSGFYTLGLISFVAIYLCLSWLPTLEVFLKDRSNHFEVHLELKNRCNLQDFITTIRQLGLKIDDIESNPAYTNSGLSVFSISITITKKELKKYRNHKEIIEALSTLDYVGYIEEIV